MIKALLPHVFDFMLDAQIWFQAYCCFYKLWRLFVFFANVIYFLLLHIIFVNCPRYYREVFVIVSVYTDCECNVFVIVDIFLHVSNILITLTYYAFASWTTFYNIFKVFLAVCRIMLLFVLVFTVIFVRNSQYNITYNVLYTVIMYIYSIYMPQCISYCDVCMCIIISVIDLQYLITMFLCADFTFSWCFTTLMSVYVLCFSVN